MDLRELTHVVLCGVCCVAPPLHHGHSDGDGFSQECLSFHISSVFGTCVTGVLGMFRCGFLCHVSMWAMDFGSDVGNLAGGAQCPSKLSPVCSYPASCLGDSFCLRFLVSTFGLLCSPGLGVCLGSYLCLSCLLCHDFFSY